MSVCAEKVEHNVVLVPMSVVRIKEVSYICMTRPQQPLVRSSSAKWCEPSASWYPCDRIHLHMVNAIGRWSVPFLEIPLIPSQSSHNPALIPATSLFLRHLVIWIRHSRINSDDYLAICDLKTCDSSGDCTSHPICSPFFRKEKRQRSSSIWYNQNPSPLYGWRR